MESNDPKINIKGGLPGVKILYLVIFIAISGLVAINLEVNLRWLRNFSYALRSQAMDYELTQARRVAGIMESAAQNEIEDIQDIAYNLSLLNLTSNEAEILIQRFLKKNYHTRELIIVDLAGQAEKRYSRSATFSQAEQNDFASLEPFEEARKGRTYLSRVNINDYAEPYVLISVPITILADDKVKAVLIGYYYLRGMWEIALETKIGLTGRISVIDDKGMLIADPQPSRVLRKTNLLSLPPSKPVILGEVFSGEKYLNEKDVAVIGVGAPIRIMDQKWGVIVEQNASEIEKLLDEVTYWLVVFLSGNLAVIVILLWLAFMVRKADLDIVQKQRSLVMEHEKSEQERNKTDAIVANFVDPIIFVDNSWRIVLLNPAAQSVLKLSEKTLSKSPVVKGGRFSFEGFRGLTDIEFTVKELQVDEKNNPLVEEVIIKSADNQIPEINPFRANAIGDDANAMIYKVTTRSVCDHNNVCYGHMKIFYDLTREKMVDQMKSEFISIAAHQLRTPLSAIKWVIKMVLDGDSGPLNEDQKILLDKGYQSNERIIKVVNDMLNVSRIEEGRFGYVFEKIDFWKVFDAVLASLEAQIKTKKIKLMLKKPVGGIMVKADRQKLNLALQNIFENAVKYTPENGTIEFSAMADKDDLVMKIKDNGVGIPRESQDKLFTKFFRAENVVRMQTEGSGLGLYIAKNIIEKHGGDISCQSEEGKGAEFTVRLPLREKAKKAQE